jgi:hypothetical protein
MKENKNFSSGIPQESKVERKPRPDLEKKLLIFINELIEKHGKIPILEYIEENTLGTIAPIVIDRWLDGGRIPWPADQRDILSTLEKLPPDKLPIINNQPASTLKPEEDAYLYVKKPRGKGKGKEQIIKKSDEKLKDLVDKLRRQGKII